LKKFGIWVGRKSNRNKAIKFTIDLIDITRGNRERFYGTFIEEVMTNLDYYKDSEFILFEKGRKIDYENYNDIFSNLSDASRGVIERIFKIW
jgi:hypothetical protein